MGRGAGGVGRQRYAGESGDDGAGDAGNGLHGGVDGTEIDWFSETEAAEGEESEAAIGIQAGIERRGDGVEGGLMRILRIDRYGYGDGEVEGGEILDAQGNVGVAAGVQEASQIDGEGGPFQGSEVGSSGGQLNVGLRRRAAGDGIRNDPDRAGLDDSGVTRGEGCIVGDAHGAAEGAKRGGSIGTNIGELIGVGEAR